MVLIKLFKQIKQHDAGIRKLIYYIYLVVAFAHLIADLISVRMMLVDLSFEDKCILEMATTMMEITYDHSD